MRDRSGGNALGFLATLWRRMWECYRNCLEANLLLRAWWPRKTAQSRPASKRSFIDGLLMPKEANSGQGVALAVVTTGVALIVTGYWYTVEFHNRAHGPVYITGATESTRALPGGIQMSLSANSILSVDDTGSQRVAFQEAGEIIYKIKATPERPFILQTAPATATAVADASLRVEVGLEAEFEVLEGTVKVALKGAKGNRPALWLRKGESWRVPVDSAKPVLAERRGSPIVSADG